MRLGLGRNHKPILDMWIFALSSVKCLIKEAVTRESTKEQNIAAY